MTLSISAKTDVRLADKSQTQSNLEKRHTIIVDEIVITLSIVFCCSTMIQCLILRELRYVDEHDYL